MLITDLNYWWEGKPRVLLKGFKLLWLTVISLKCLKAYCPWSEQSNSKCHAHLCVFIREISTLSHSFNYKLESLNLHITLNRELNKVYDWILVNKININIDKTKYILFNYKINKRISAFYIANSAVNRINDFKLLGVIFDENLKFDEYANHVSIVSYLKRWVWYLVNDLLRHSDVHSHNTGNFANIMTPRFRRAISQMSIAFTGPKLWNSKPDSIKNPTMITTFKQSLKCYMVDWC